MSAVALRATVDSIVRQRNEALGLYDEAHRALMSASEAVRRAAGAASAAAPTVTSYNHMNERAREHLLTPIKVPARDDYLASARAVTDKDVWAHIVAITDLERLMDKKAKDALRQQLMTDPPEVTVENVTATLEQMFLDRDTIFKRGIAECFSNLDRRFRSHDGWKIGSRVILSSAFNDTGHWSYYRNHRDTMQDIERTFMVLEGLPMPPNYAGLVGAIEHARGREWGARQTEVETEYFTVRIFKNGNAHVWFKRDDLLDKVNRLLGEYYGAPIPEEREAEDDGGLNTPKTTPAKHYGFYPTPEAAALTLIENVPMYRRDGEPVLTVLEPSAGTGNLAGLLAAKGAAVDCVEIQAHLANDLSRSGRYRQVVRADFLALRPDALPAYDRVVMNPPFDRERDIDHVMHALKFLKPDGFLTAIMSAGTEFRETRKSTAFRALMEQMNAHWRDLPPGSFAEAGTYCNTIILSVWKNGRGAYG